MEIRPLPSASTPQGCRPGSRIGEVVMHPQSPASCVHPGAFDLFSNLNGTIKDDFSEFDNLRTSKKTGM